jgi:hypothetical protein
MADPTKLATPTPRLRFVIHRDRIDPVACGVFPPEAAEELRALGRTVAAKAWPEVKRQMDEDQRQYIDRLLYGDPNAPEPAGIMGCSPLADIPRR